MRWTAFPILLAFLLLASACGETDGGEGTPTTTLPAETTVPQPSATREAPTPDDATNTIDHESAWAIPNQEVLVRLRSCSTKRFECFESVMEDNGALPAAIEFFRQTRWFMVEYREMGRVDVAGILDPWRANSNSDYALVNGSPAIIYAEEEGWNVSDSLQDPDPASLEAAYPDLLLWGSDNVFESVVESPQGGQAFIFQYSLTDGCHACTTGAFQRAALDFAPDGTYIGPRLLDVCESDSPFARAPSVTPVPGIDACPFPIASVLDERAGEEAARARRAEAR